MKRIAVPFSSFVFFSRERIPSCVVTSSAVVGSSQMSSRGSETIAAAIITRWSIPPDSSCGYLRYTAAGSGSSAWAIASSARSRRAAASSWVWTTRASSTCGPMRIVGSRAVIGSWNTTAISRPRRARTSSRGAVSRSRPAKRIAPRSSVRALLSRPVSAIAVMLLPLPDSPTSPSTSPGAMEKEIPFTASCPSGADRNRMCRSWMSNKRSSIVLSPSQPRRRRRCCQPSESRLGPRIISTSTRPVHSAYHGARLR